MTTPILRAALARSCTRMRCTIPRRAFTVSSRLSCSAHVAQPSEASSSSSSSASGPLSQPSNEEPQRLSGLSALRGAKRKGKKAHLTDEIRTIFGQSPDLPIRARFAPSPTGQLHLGSLRTALFNKLAVIASNGGSFILRIEDTDQNRLVEGAEESVIEDLKWLGLTWEEGPDCGGPYGPYRQSERLPLYKEHAEKLLKSGHAYRCFCNIKQLVDQRKRQLAAGEVATAYPKTCRSIDAAESQRRAASEEHVVRFKGDAFGNLPMRDAVYGFFQKKDAEEDFIIVKSDGFPTYHLANVVDDHLMKITHVIRGEEWLISTPKHVALYEAFGWQPPTFAHLGLLVNEDMTKLSKRQRSANVASYRDRGISPVPLQMWLASLGSSFGRSLANTAKTIPRSVQDVANLLSFKFTKGSIKLNQEKLENFETIYRKAIVTLPPSYPALELKERHYIRNNILRPAFLEFAALTPGAPPPPETPDSPTLVSPGDSLKSTAVERPFIDKAWDTSKEPVPALPLSEEHEGEGKESRALAKLHEIYWWFIQNTATAFEPSMSSLLLKSPYLFWRVPEDLYRRSLALHYDDKTLFDQRVLDTLETLCDDGTLWPSHVSQPSLVHGVLVDYATKVAPPPDSALDVVNKQTIYTTHRLVMTGQPSVSSPSVDFLSRLLGLEETKYRVQVVQRLAEELRAGGEQVRREWLREAWEMYPDFMRYSGVTRSSLDPPDVPTEDHVNH